MLTHPIGYASYAVPVQPVLNLFQDQYRYLQCGLLQCMNHFKPRCGLLMLRVINPAHKRLSLFGFLLLRTIFTIQGAHSVFIKLWLDDKHIRLLFAILLLWLIETDVFQLPQLHKHFNVVRYYLTFINCSQHYDI